MLHSVLALAHLLAQFNHVEFKNVHLFYGLSDFINSQKKKVILLDKLSTLTYNLSYLITQLQKKAGKSILKNFKSILIYTPKF